MKFVLGTIIGLILSGCYYPQPQTQVDPITKTPTGETRSQSTSDPILATWSAGAAAVSQNKKEKKKKDIPLPKPPDEVLKPMKEDTSSKAP